MNTDSMLEMIIGSVVATFFGWLLEHLTDNQTEIKKDVKEIITVVTELRISFAAQNKGNIT